ncbi:hypothetical protein D3C76_1528490 [compost metagenome]
MSGVGDRMRGYFVCQGCIDGGDGAVDSWVGQNASRTVAYCLIETLQGQFGVRHCLAECRRIKD